MTAFRDPPPQAVVGERDHRRTLLERPLVVPVRPLDLGQAVPGVPDQGVLALVGHVARGVVDEALVLRAAVRVHLEPLDRLHHVLGVVEVAVPVAVGPDRQPRNVSSTSWAIETCGS